MPSLKEVIISITNRCNLRCRMCDIPRVETEELSTSAWERVIQDAASVGANTIVFSGGEPLLRDDLCDLVSFTKKLKMTACITSNGVLLEEARTYELLRAGIDVVNISIEGPREVHDYFRGEGNFNRALAAIDNLRKHGIECTVASVVSAKNFMHLPYIVELAKQHGAATIKFQPFNRLFISDANKGDEYFLSIADTDAFEQVTKQVIGLCDSYGISTNPQGYFHEMCRYLTQNTGANGNSCAALYSSCPINARGEVFPCWVLCNKAYIIGRVTENSFASIWNSGRREAMIEKIRKKGCQGCVMSCYDDNFGKEGFEEKVSRNLASLRRNGPRGYLSSKVKQWKRRFKFYASWRGGASSALRRIKAKLEKKSVPCQLNDKEKEIAAALDEIRRIKQLFKEEIRLS